MNERETVSRETPWWRRLVKWWMCDMRGRHDRNRSLNDMPESAVFYRIDCNREGCDTSIDGVAIAALRDQEPDLWAYVKGRMP